jgi:long-chain acyl-CoA synthetase
MSIAANLVHSASAHADRVALRLDETRMTSREFDTAGTRVAGSVPRPWHPGGVMLPNVMEFAVAYHGVLRAGGAWSR